MSGRGRSGFTIVEVIMVLGVLGAVLTAAVLAGTSSHRRSVRLDERASAQRDAQVLLERLRADLDAFVPAPSLASPTEKHSALRLVRVASTAGRLPLDAKGGVLTEQVAYEHDPVSGRLRRNGRPLPVSALAGVHFAYVPARPEDDEPPYGDQLVVEIAPRGGGAPLQFRLAVPQGTAARLHATWAD
jgi:prepilin-type N-terminal cleavage/methylation domain-containing protein